MHGFGVLCVKIVHKWLREVNLNRTFYKTARKLSPLFLLDADCPLTVPIEIVACACLEQVEQLFLGVVVFYRLDKTCAERIVFCFTQTVKG